MKKLALLAVLFVLFGMPSSAFAVQVGDTGIAKTTIRGSEVSTFNVEVIGIVDNPGMYPSYLIRVYGSAIDFTGGIAEGMSGSPVYIDGNLIGAISAAFQNSDPHIGLVTPIEAMKSLWDYESKQPAVSKLERPVVIDGKTFTAVSRLPADTDSYLVEKPCVLYYEKGFSGRVLSMLKKDTPLTAELSGETAQGWIPQPGAPIAIQFARGSVELGAVGTLTDIEGNKVLAFGHPATDSGNVDYFLSSAYVYYTVKSQVLPFKVASIISPVGEVVQDRAYGIAAYLGTLPVATTIDVNVNAHGTHSSFVQLPQNEGILLKYASKVVLQSLDDALLSQHGGSSVVDMTVRLSDGTSIERKNVYSDQDDISYKSVLELDEILNKVLTNPFRSAVPEYIGFNITVSDKTKSAQIDTINVNDRVNKSDPIKFEVVLRPYRENAYRENVSINPDLPKGEYIMVVRGNEESSDERAKLSDNNAPNAGPSAGNASGKQKGESPESFDQLIKSIVDRPKNNQLIIELYANQQSSQDKPEPAFKKYIDFPWSITGLTSKTIEIR